MNENSYKSTFVDSNKVGTEDIIFGVIFLACFSGIGLLIMLIGIANLIFGGQIEIFIFMFLFGLVFFVVGLAIGLPPFKEASKSKLVTTGTKITAKVSKVEFLTNVYINGVNPGYIHAVYTTSFGTVANFKTRNLGRNLKSVYNVGDPITVYVADEKCKKYTFDYNEITQKIFEVEGENDFGGATMGPDGLPTFNQAPARKEQYIDYNQVFQNDNKENHYGAYNSIKNSLNDENTDNNQ